MHSGCNEYVYLNENLSSWHNMNEFDVSAHLGTMSNDILLQQIART